MEHHSPNGPKSEARTNRLLEIIADYCQALREAHSHADALLRHEDSMAVWISGLAAGAVVALPAALSQILDVKHLLWWGLALSFLPFVLATLTGIAYRLSLAEIMEKDKLFAVAKIHDVEMLRFRELSEESDFKILEQEFFSIMDDKPADLAKLDDKVKKLQKFANYLRFFPYILFGLGVIGVAIIAILLR
jgi:hypothetical protein